MMEPVYLLVDVGNTRLKWALHQQGILIPGEPLRLDVDDLEEHFSRIWEEVAEPVAITVSTVAGPPVNDRLAAWLRQRWSAPLRLVSSVPTGTGLQPVPVYPDAARFGVDRWLALVAMRSCYGYPAVVVDCGTAIKLDVLDPRGEHAGGLLLPGLGLMRQSLFLKVPHVPAYDEPGSGFLGSSTVSCLQRGTVLAAAGMIDKTLNKLERQYVSPARLVFTGGDADTVCSAVDHPGEVDSLLVLRGVMQL